MRKKYIQCFILVILSSIGYGQTAVLCPAIEDIIGIEDINNVPVVTDNGDGTISLMSPEQYITDIFTNYMIYDFIQTFPNTSETLEKYYTISYGDKNLIVELNESVPEDVFFIESDYEYTSISPEFIDFLDEKQFRLTHYCSIADNSGEPCPEQEVPEDVNISVTFNYDAITDMILMESFGLTECGNSFSIALRGGTEPNTLQLWKSTPGIITQTNYDSDACHNIEAHLFSLLDISCNGINLGNIIPTIDTIDNTLFLYRQNMIFGYDTATFVAENLSVTEQPFERIRLYQSEGNPFLQISNAEEQLYLEIISVAGSTILNRVRFETNQISIDQYSNGLYFIKVSDDNDKFKIFKFLKR
jgi:hypothetical protein